jgi:hypothetical protein
MLTLRDQLTRPPQKGSIQYVKLLGLVPALGTCGPFIRILCEDDEGLGLEAQASEREIDYLEPYFALVQQSKYDVNTEAPVIPIFLDYFNRWRFSWQTAAQDFPELNQAQPPRKSGPPENERPFRLQVTVTASVAKAFDELAASRGTKRQELLMLLVEDALTWTG